MPLSSSSATATGPRTDARAATALRTADGDLRPLPVIVVMLVTRVVIAWNWVVPEEFALGDIPYYWSRISELGEVGIEATMREYPTPMVWLFSIPHWLGGGTEDGYAGWFVAFILAADLTFCALIAASRLPRRGWAIALWSVACMALGPLIWLRFDLVPSVIVGGALLLAARRPATAGGLLAVGAGTKLWPGVFLPLLLNRPRTGGGRSWVAPTVGFVVTGAALVVASLVAGGWTRLVSPLVWQSDRGLQIESVPASVLMTLRAIRPARWEITISQYQAFEIFGAGVEEFLVVADVLAVVGVGLGLAVVVWHWRRAYADPAGWATGAAVATIAIVGLLIVTNKTLSPQYVIWLAGPVAALVAGHRPGVRGSRAAPVVRWSVLLLATAALTHVVFPELYDRLNGMADDPVWSPWATVALVLRNLLLVIFTADVVRHALRRNPRTVAPGSDGFGYPRLKA
ncbi:glycosyltransferase 87 family protein [Granulicoccus sp. GXG6511]|uniref:glycosyltransferase 87 family protein n=1 Tax=Granulicoccus sp. GXG6511 TaxID=3381351 RepID=UPI003D7E747B